MNTKSYRFLLIVLPSFFYVIFSANTSLGQINQWTWMHGDSTDNSTGIFGVKGVSSPTNVPPAVYETSNWTDLNGNFWIFSGTGFSLNSQIPQRPNLWKFDPTINEWTWVHGPGPTGTFNASVVGMGIADTSNHPGMTKLGSTTWVDQNNNLWLFGGNAYCPTGGFGKTNDLWKYSIANNTWTWVKGSGLPDDNGVAGTLGVSSPTNLPRARCETTAGWKDCNGNLWLTGGVNSAGATNDVWRYSVQQNEWTRMEGNSSGNPTLPNYGTINVESSTNSPGTRSPYAVWSDTCNRVYMFGGNYIYSTFGDMWTYSTDSENWTWLGGSTITNEWGDYGDLGIASCSNRPSNRMENKAVWKDNCDNFWMYGGFFIGSTVAFRSFNDLWKYDPRAHVWTWMDGDSALYPGTYNYGVKGISATSNQPRGREGAVSFTDLDGNFWLFGGLYRTGPPTLYHVVNDMWKYVPNSTCYNIGGGIVSSFNANPLIGCDSLEVSFSNTGSFGLYQWSFGDGTYSAERNPVHTYSSSGIYTVSLITSGDCFSQNIDTLTMNNLIIVNNSSSGTDVVVSCDSIIWIDGNTYSQSTNTPTMTLTNVVGCDSLVTLDLAIGYTIYDAVTANACFNYVSPWGDTLTISGIYSDTIVNSLGCDSILLLNLSIYSSVALVLSDSISHISCLGFNDGQINLTMSGGLNPYTYLWSNGDTLKDTEQLTAGIYTVTVTDASGCSMTSSIMVNTPQELLIAGVVINESCPSASDGSVSIIPSGGTSPYSYLWSFLGTGNSSINYITSGSYIVTITDFNSCLGVDTFIVDIDSTECDTVVALNIPNFFSPNGDGTNDTWIIRGYDKVPNLVIEIFNRWGGIVYRSDGYMVPWDGSYEGQLVPVATYYYVLMYGENDSYSGTITLIR